MASHLNTLHRKKTDSNVCVAVIQFKNYFKKINQNVVCKYFIFLLFFPLRICLFVVRCTVGGFVFVENDATDRLETSSFANSCDFLMTLSTSKWRWRRCRGWQLCCFRYRMHFHKHLFCYFWNENFSKYRQGEARLVISSWMRNAAWAEHSRFRFTGRSAGVPWHGLNRRQPAKTMNYFREIFHLLIDSTVFDR